MLDAFIIEKIRKERDLRDSGREQLHIEIRRDRVHDERERKDEETEERGIYGQATREETEELLDEGIEVGLVPWVRDSDA